MCEREFSWRLCAASGCEGGGNQDINTVNEG